MATLFFQDYLIGNHGRNGENEKDLFENAVNCFTGAHRARPLSRSDYVSNFLCYF